MLRIIVITLTFAVLWSIRWFWFAGPNQAMIENWVEGGADIAAYSDIRQVGFPNRYDVTLNDLRIANNDFEIFETDVLQIMRLAYRRDHFVLAFSNNIKIVGQNIKTSQNRASIVRQENDVQRVVWEANDIALDNGATIKRGQMKEEFMAHAQLVSPSSSLRIESGKRFLTLKLKDLENYISSRAKRGNMLPQGYRKVDKMIEEVEIMSSEDQG